MKQTLTDNKFGNCLQTCLAKLFKKQLDHVPNFMLFEHHWWTAFIMYLGINGYSSEFICNEPPPNDDKEYIVSLRFKFLSKGIAHVVIMKNNQVVFDPWPIINYKYEDSLIVGYYVLIKIK